MKISEDSAESVRASAASIVMWSLKHGGCHL